MASASENTAVVSHSKTTWHWSCASLFCKNSWRSEGIGYYRLTKIQKFPKEARDKYLEVIGKSKEKINWKKEVICSAHWSSGVRKVLEDLPDKKYTMKEETKTNWHCNCAATLCNNSWRTQGIRYYRLSEVAKDKSLESAYSKVLKNARVKWQKHVIFSEHWSDGYRKSLSDLPDKSTKESYLRKKVSKITPPRKLESAKRSLQAEDAARHVKKPRRKLLVRTDLDDPREDEIAKLSAENSVLQAKLLEVQETLRSREKELTRMAEQVAALKTGQQEYERQVKLFQSEFQRSRFTYDHVMKRGQCFYMTGLTESEFNCLFECVDPFIDCLIYPDCKSCEVSRRKLDKRTELMCYMTILRHDLHLGVMGWMSNTSAANQRRLFVAWSVFLVVLFESIDLTPLPGELQAFLPKDFNDAGFGDTSCLGDCTESRIAASENFDINTITFSQYKNHTTGKTAVWIAPHGSLLQCSDTYPGTITDNAITEQCGVLDMLEKGTIVLTDKGFGITDLCLAKGLHHNRPPMKYSVQYDESEISENFDVATLRIYNENYIGRMRDWAMMNACWPSNRIDILGYVHKVLAHIVNIFKKPIAPKDKE